MIARRKGLVENAALSLIATFCIQPFIALNWWHPYCDKPEDGPGYFGIGFPLPHSRLTGASSMEFTLSIPLFAFDIIVIAAIIFLLVGLLQHGKFWLWIRRILLTLIAPYFCLVAFFMWDSHWPIWALDLDRDAIWSFRPAVMIDGQTHRMCDL